MSTGARPGIQGLHLKPEKSLQIKRSLWLSQDLNRRIREQHDRLRKEHADMTKSFREFMVHMLEVMVGHLEAEANQGALIMQPGAVTDKQMKEWSDRLEAIKKGVK